MANNIGLNKNMILIILGIVLTASVVSAGFAVSFPYKISLHPGETYEGSFSLQNVLQPSEDTTIEIIVESGNEYIQFPEGTTIQLAENETKNVPVKVTLPEDVNLDKYSIQLLFQPVSAQNQGGTVDIVLALRKSFDIDVIRENNKKTAIAITLLIIVAIILLILLLKVLRNKKNK